MTREQQAEEQKIRQIVDRWFEAENRKDIEVTMAFMADDCALQLPGTPQIKGSKAIRGFFAMLFPSLVSTGGGTWKVDVSGSCDIAYGIGPNRVVTEGSSGRVESVGKWFIVWKKLDNQWKAVAASFSSDGP